MKRAFSLLAAALWLLPHNLSAQTLEIRSAQLEQRASYAVAFACMDQAAVPSRFHSKPYSLMKVPMPAVEAGLVLVIAGDNTLVVTTQECLDEVKDGVTRGGGDPSTLVITSD